MKKFDMRLLTALVALAGAVASSRAEATPMSTATFTTNYNLQSGADGSFSDSFNVPIQGFNPALGSLTAAHFTFTPLHGLDVVPATNLLANTLYNIQAITGIRLSLDNGAALWDEGIQSSVITFRTLRTPPGGTGVIGTPIYPVSHGPALFDMTGSIINFSVSGITASTANIGYSFHWNEASGTLTDSALLATLIAPGQVDLDLAIDSGAALTQVTTGMGGNVPGTLLNGETFAGIVSVRYDYETAEPVAVPEPGTLFLLGAGLAGISRYRRRSRQI